MATSNTEIFSEPACAPALWLLDPQITFLNHGSFGSCPRVILDLQTELRERMEKAPVEFLARDLEPMLDQSRSALAEFVGAPPDDLVFVTNATTGINTVLRSLDWRPDDDLLVTNHEYNASRNALHFAAARAGARVVVAEVPFPVRAENEIVDAILEAVTSRTRLALLDHVTSQTGLVLPMERLVQALRERGVETLVDGAHAPGMIPLNLEKLGAAYYTGNCHKWLCSPKGAGFLYVRRDKQGPIRPLSISHGANSPRTDRSRFLIEFGWTGTCDPSAYLCLPEALRYMGSLLKGGWPDVMRHNHLLAVKAREVICPALGIDAPCPPEMIGSLASFPIPNGSPGPVLSPLYADPVQEQLRLRHGIEVPVVPWPGPPRRLLRISAQLYNSLPQYERLAQALRAELDPPS